jgi:2'-5' RNA ligase
MRLRMYGGLPLGTVLATRLAGEVAALTRLAEGCAAAARHAGVEIADRPFRAHLTLARATSRDRTSLRELARALSAYEGPWWQADAIELVHSHLGSAPRYETLQRWPLGPRSGHAPAQV